MNSGSSTKQSPAGRYPGPRSPNKLRSTSRKPNRSGLSLKSIVCGVTLGIMAILRSLPKWAWGVIIWCVLAWALTLVVKSQLNIPTVQESYPDRTCVQVVYPDGRTGSCDKLPSRYRRVWVY